MINMQFDNYTHSISKTTVESSLLFNLSETCIEEVYDVLILPSIQIAIQFLQSKYYGLCFFLYYG